MRSSVFALAFCIAACSGVSEGGYGATVVGLEILPEEQESFHFPVDGWIDGAVASIRTAAVRFAVEETETRSEFDVVILDSPKSEKSWWSYFAAGTIRDPAVFEKYFTCGAMGERLVCFSLSDRPEGPALVARERYFESSSDLVKGLQVELENQQLYWGRKL